MRTLHSPDSFITALTQCNKHLGSLPLQIEIRWNPQIAARLMKARKLDCQKIDQRTGDWRHKISSLVRECKCLSQVTVARQLGITQGLYSKLEAGKTSGKGLDIRKLHSVFGDRLVYILTGEDSRIQKWRKK